MYFKFLIAVVILSFLATTCPVYAVGNDESNAAGNMEEVFPSSMLRRGLAAWKPVWWDRIKNSYKGNDLKLCSSRSAPAKGSSCGKNKTTCFFGNRTCPTVGANPTVKCVCNGTKTKKGKWSCTTVKCPTLAPTSAPTPAPTPFPTPVPTPGVFRSSPGRAFNVRMNLLSSKVLQGYDKLADLLVDLDQAVRFYVNGIIEQESLNDYQYFPSFPGVTGTPPNKGETGGLNVPAPAPTSAEGATDFETNNQEDGVDESDLVKSDGIHVFAAYGDIVVIWNAATGKFVANYTLPPIITVDVPTDNVFGGGGVSGGIGKPAIGGMMPPFYYQPKPVIQGMSLVAKRLVLYVQGYGSMVRAEKNVTSALGEAYETRVIVLDTSKLPTTITVVTQEDIQGGFRDARSIGNNIHLVTSAYINFYQLAGPLYRYNSAFAGMNSTQYKAAATKIAKPLIADFVTMLKNDILLNGKAPDIPKIAIWQTEVGANGNVIERIYSGGAIQAYVQLTSFSVQGLTGDLTLSTAGAFTPTSWGYTYAVDGNLVFAAEGWNWSPWWRGSSQTTYLLGFKLDGASATPAYLGSVDGYIINQYSLSVYEGHLRVATTVNTFWPVWEPVADSNGVTILPQPVSTTNNSVHVLKIPTGNETKLTEVTAITGLGKPNERLTAVRFFNNICYAVTFLQTDPFYVLDLNPAGAKVLGELEISGFSSYIESINADDTLLVAVGQEADKDGRILGVQVTLFDATNPAKPIQLQRAVVEQESDVWSSSNVQWDFKSFRWLSLGDGVGILIIPLQVVAFNSNSPTGNFDGFFLYDVSRTGISQRMNITHAASQDFYGCYYQTYLPERSFVFNGNVTTMKGHSVISTDLDTGKRRWDLDMPKPANTSQCVFWVY